MSDTAKCSCCGFTRLKSELDDNGQDPCCPSSKRAPRTDRGERRTRLSVPKNQDGGGAGETSPSSEKQGKLF